MKMEKNIPTELMSRKYFGKRGSNSATAKTLVFRMARPYRSSRPIRQVHRDC